MGRLLDLLLAAGGEASIRSRLGRWRVELSEAVDGIASGEIGDVPTSREVIAGQGLTGGGDLSQDVTLALDPTLESSILGTAALALGSGISDDGGFGYLTQSDWGVDSVSGDDTGPGTAAEPLLTLGELTRRWQGRAFSPLLATVTVVLTGTFPTEKLVLNAAVPGATVITVSGQMTEVDTGTIDTYVAFSAATNVRASVTDATQDFTANIRRRIRVTSGASAGAVTFVAPTAGTGPTQGLIGQFTSLAASSFTVVNPANGSTYSIETFVTQIAGYDIQLPGKGTFNLRDVDILSSATVVTQCYMLVSGSRFTGRLFGCRFSGPSTTRVEGWQDWGACSNENAVQLGLGRYGMQQLCHFASITYLGGAQVGGQNTIHDGGGTTSVVLSVVNGAILEDTNHRGIFGNPSGDTLVLIDDGGVYTLSVAAALLWGGVAPSGTNVATTAVRVRTQTTIQWITLPTLVASTPGVSDVIYGGTVANWATAAPGVVHPTNGACAAPRA